MVDSPKLDTREGELLAGSERSVIDIVRQVCHGQHAIAASFGLRRTSG
jgi:hypothetical protein